MANLYPEVTWEQGTRRLCRASRHTYLMGDQHNGRVHTG